MESAFAAHATFFIATEWRGGIELVIGVSPYHARIEFRRHVEDLGTFVGPYTGRQSVRGIVRFLQAFFNGPEGLYREDGPEDFFLDNPVRLRAGRGIGWGYTRILYEEGFDRPGTSRHHLSYRP